MSSKAGRPQTRAWVKAQVEAALLHTYAVASSAAKTTPIQPILNEVSQPAQPATQEVAGKTKPGSRNSGVRAAKRKRPIKPKLFKPNPVIRRSERRSARTDSSNEAQQGRAQENASSAAEVSTWLGQVQSVSPNRVCEEKSLYTASVLGVAFVPSEDMDWRSNSYEQRENESTAKTVVTRKNKLTELKLRFRRVKRAQQEDVLMSHLRSILKKEPPACSREEISELGTAAQDFAQQIQNHPADSCWPLIDDYSLKFDEGKARLNYPIINPAYFNTQLKKCLSKNEAVLQRTIMMSVFHPYWLGNDFDWNAEGQWSLPQDVRLPSREDDNVILPKPDLSISFTLESFTGDDDSDPLPQDLEKCISPDGGDRCFPFLFMEVKKASSDLQDAYLANLHSASQALYNIYLWVARTGREKEFFDKVRVFSFVFNAQDLSVRVHRAGRLLDGNLAFYFDEFYPSARYTRDQVCLLVDSIINQYAAKELHAILLQVYKDVVLQEDRRVLSKRKADAARNVKSKRPRESNDMSNQTVAALELYGSASDDTMSS